MKMSQNRFFITKTLKEKSHGSRWEGLRHDLLRTHTPSVVPTNRRDITVVEALHEEQGFQAPRQCPLSRGAALER